MLYVDLPLSKIKEKLVAYGMTKTSSKRFIRYEKRFNKDSHIIAGVEISKYHNIYELMCYWYSDIAKENYDNDTMILKLVNNDLAKLFSDNLIANE